MDPRPAWTKRQHRDELELLVDLGDPLLKFALDALRDLYCVRGGKLPDDDKFIAGNLALSLQKWRPLKARLIARNLISIRGGMIECPLALQAYVEAVSLLEQRRQAGIRSGLARRGQVNEGTTGREERAAPHNLSAYQPRVAENEIKDLAPATVQDPFEPQRRTDRRKNLEAGYAVSIADALQEDTAPALARALMRRAKRDD